MTIYTSPTTTVTVAASSGGGGGSGTYEYPLNTAYVRVVRPVSDVVGRIKRAVRDSTNQRWSDEEIYHAINRALDEWANRVYIPCLYDTPDDLSWDIVEYPMPYYIREPVILQRKTERWYWTPDNQDKRFSDVQGGYMVPDGQGGQHLHVEAGVHWLTTEDLRVLWYAEVGHVPTEAVSLSSAMTVDDDTLTVDKKLIHTVGDVGYVLIDEEIIQYSGVTETATTTILHELVRGANNTLIAAHAASVPVEWCIPYVDSSLYGVLISQSLSFMHEYYMSDASARETEHHQWQMRWDQQKADDFWMTWLPNRSPQIKMNRSAIISERY